MAVWAQNTLKRSRTQVMGIFISVLFWLIIIILLSVFVLLCSFLITEKPFLAATTLHLTDVMVKSHLVYVLYTPD